MSATIEERLRLYGSKTRCFLPQGINGARPHLLYLNKGKYRLAVDSLKKFVELAPDDPQAENIKNLIPKLEELIKDN